VSRPSTIYAVRRLCRRALPYLGGHPVRMITKTHILMMVNDLAETRLNKWRGNSSGGALSEASGVLRHLRSLFRWAVDEDLSDRRRSHRFLERLGGRIMKFGTIGAGEVAVAFA
jgi:hypothetical protein